MRSREPWGGVVVMVPATGGSGRLEGLEFLGRSLRTMIAPANVQALPCTGVGSGPRLLDVGFSFLQIRFRRLRSRPHTQRPQREPTYWLPMNVAALTETEFLGSLTNTGPTTSTASEVIKTYGIDPGARFPVLRDYKKFQIVDLSDGNTGLEDSSGKLVGVYIRDIVIIDHHTLPPTVRGASVPLILFAANLRPSPPVSRIVSPEGERALRRAWRVANSIEKSPWWP